MSIFQSVTSLLKLFMSVSSKAGMSKKRIVSGSCRRDYRNTFCGDLEERCLITHASRRIQYFFEICLLCCTNAVGQIKFQGALVLNQRAAALHITCKKNDVHRYYRTFSSIPYFFILYPICRGVMPRSRAAFAWTHPVFSSASMIFDFSISPTLAVNEDD